MVAILKAPAGEVPTYEVPEGFESAHVAVMAAADVCSSLGHTLRTTFHWLRPPGRF